MLRSLSTVASLILLAPISAWAHGDGLDSNGGHLNRKTGVYHCHREPCFSIIRKQKPSPVKRNKQDQVTEKKRAETIRKQVDDEGTVHLSVEKKKQDQPTDKRATEPVIKRVDDEGAVHLSVERKEQIKPTEEEKTKQVLKWVDDEGTVHLGNVKSPGTSDKSISKSK